MNAVRIVFAAAFLCGAGSVRAETNYAFRVRMADLHPPRLSTDAAPVGEDEVCIDGSWSVHVAEDDADGVLVNGASGLAAYFRKSMGVPIGKTTGPGGGTAGGRKVVVAVDPTLEKLQSKISVSDSGIRVTGVTAREAAQGCYRLEDMMTARGRPAVKKGVRTFTRLFSPRMTHSGWEIEKFPEVYMDHIARAGMDAIIVFIEDPPDTTRNGREDIAALVKTAAKHGLDVYAYAFFPVKAAKMHPLDPGAEVYYDKIYGSIVRNAPGLKGLVCVGESVAFQSRDGNTAGYWWGDAKTRVKGKRLNGFWPSTDWKDWLELVSKVTRRYRPDFDIVFWTYNWHWAPEKDRLALLSSIPTDITVHVTFEMGAPPVYRDGVMFRVDDYSITNPGPSPTFVSEARLCRRRGIALSSMSNTGGRTWDFGGLPLVPVPYAWMERFRNLRSARKDFGLSGLMESHHYGFTPNFMAEIAKAAFTREFDEADLEMTLRGIAARDFGFANVEDVLAAWRDWSEAMKWHSARSYDQYGPLRVGASYPFNLPGVTMPDPPHPQYEYHDGIKHGTGWKYLAPSYPCKDEELQGRIGTDRRELALLEQGNDRLESVLPKVPSAKLAAARRMLGYGKYMAATIRTLINTRRYRLACLARDEDERQLILKEESANVRSLIPWVENDSLLGFEPSMRYVTDREMLEWKLKQLSDESSVRLP